MPLLREHVRAERVRRSLWLVATVAVFVAAVATSGFFAWRAWSEADEDVPPLAARASAPRSIEAPQPAEEVLDDATPTTGTTRTRFGRAIGFRPALIASGVTDAESAALETSLQGVLDFRRCHPEDELVFERNASGALQSFRYQQEESWFVEARLVDGAWSARRVERPVQITQVARGGTVRSSLGDAMEAVGLGRGVVGVFVEVFDGKINFATGARAGDSFRVLVDEERLDGRFLRFGQVRALEYVGARSGHLKAYYFEEHEGRGDWYGEDAHAVRGGWLRVPCRYDRMSSPFDPQRLHPILRRVVPHNGVDFAAATGTPVWAAADGVVSWAGPKGPNGNLVSIRHDGGYESHYAHLHRIQRGIRVGAQVRQRDPIGAVGTTGRSTGPHLHFGLKRQGRFVDPMVVMNGPGRALAAPAAARFRREMRLLDERLRTVPLASAPAAAPAHEDSTESFD